MNIFTYAAPGFTTQLNFWEAMTYDGVNRLSSISDSGGWSESFSYVDQNNKDYYGNMWVASATGLSLNAQTPTTATAYDLTTNRLKSPAAYDAAGDQLVPLAQGATYSYDEERRMISVTDTPLGTTNYTYDGDGRRILKQQLTSGVTTTYIYDAFGQLASEYNSNSTIITPVCNTCFLSWDHLGSTRMVTDQSGNLIARHDYLPFGGEILSGTGGRTSAWGATDGVNQKFTGKERDSETTLGLDYFEARYMSSAQGRFTSPDPSNLSVDFWYPQSWNRYAYSLNNPLAVVDRNGLWPTWVHNEIINEAFPGLSKDQLQNLQTASKNVDSDQSLAGSYKHGMANGQDPNGTVHAEMDSDEFISNNLHDAKSIQAAWIASGHTGIAPGALTAFGNALHTITDKTSPSHQYFQPWYGMGLFDLPEAGYHFVREAWPWGGNQQRQQNAVDAARQYFLLTFGSDTAAQAETPKKPKVKSKICYQTDNGLVCQQ